MKSLICGALVALTGASGALAQSNPGFKYKQVPTTAQWAAAFSAKQDWLGAQPLLITGGVMQGRLGTAPSTNATAGFNIPLGTPPGSPINGDIWSTASGFFVQIMGVTFNLIAAPLSVGSSTITSGTNGRVLYDNAGVLGEYTQQGAINAIAPTPTRAGDIIYYNGGNWVGIAGNNSGTQFLQENASGVPSWSTASGSGTVTSVAVTPGPWVTATGTCTVTSTGSCAVSAPFLSPLVAANYGAL